MLPDIYASYDVRERQKDPQDRTKLGAVLELCEQRYSELEEIVDRFVGEITVLVNTIAQFPKYRDAKDVRGSARVTPRRQSTPR